jgi:dihydrofolate reductase
MQKCLIIAVADNEAIGRDNRIPWYLPDDLAHFKSVTIGHPVIMGRLTHESILRQIGQTLPGRQHIVVSSSMGEVDERVIVVRSLNDAFQKAEELNALRAFVIGGARLFSEAVPLVDVAYVTCVDAAPKHCDVFFPDAQKIGKNGDTRVMTEYQSFLGQPRNEYPFVIKKFERVDP